MTSTLICHVEIKMNSPYFNTESKQKGRINVTFIDMVGNLDKSQADSSIQLIFVIIIIIRQRYASSFHENLI